MMGKAHMVIGAGIGLGLVAIFPEEPSAWAGIPVGLVAGGLPDVLDSEHAAGRKPLGIHWPSIKRRLRIKGSTPKLLVVLIILTGILPTLFSGLAATLSGGRRRRSRRPETGELMGLLFRSLGALLMDGIAAIIPHRGVTHWGITWFLLSILAVEASLLFADGLAVGLAFSLGYLAHLLADMMTKSGVKFLAPVVDYSFHLLPKPLRFRFDSPVQWLVVAAVIGIAWCMVATQLSEMSIAEILAFIA